MDLRQWIIAAAGVSGTTAFGVWLDGLDIPTLALVIIMIVCLAIVWWLTVTAGRAPLGWAELESRFAGLVERDGVFQRGEAGEIRAEHERRADGTWCWVIDGGDATLRRGVRRLCELAGAELQRSPRLSKTAVLKRQDHDSRWLYFLMDIGEGQNDKSVRIDSAGTWSRRPRTGDVVTYYPYSIPGLVKASINGCLECLKTERTDQGGVS